MTDPLFTFEEKGHQYKYDGKLVTGVTTIINVLAKPALIGWAARMACEHIKENSQSTKDIKYSGEESVLTYLVKESVLEEARTAHTKKKEAAGTHGTDVHALVEEWIGKCIEDFEGRPTPFGGIVTKEDKALSLEPIMKFIDWAYENVDHFLFSERRMFNKELFIAGTADFAYVGKDGKRYIADFKTSSGIYGIDYWLQVAAYRLLAEAEGDAPYDGAAVVRLGKDGSFDVQYLYEYETYKEAFLCCLTLYRAQTAIKDLVVKE